MSHKNTEKQNEKSNESLSNDYSYESELSSVEDNLLILRNKNKNQIKAKNYKEHISERVRFRAFEFINLKTNDYIYNCMNGIHKLLYDWELKKHSRILPSTDLKQLILILLHREKEIIEDVIDIIYAVDYDIDSCGCIITKSNINTICYKQIDKIVINDATQLKTDNETNIENKSLNFEYAFPDIYNYIQDSLHISLEYTIYIPSYEMPKV